MAIPHRTASEFVALFDQSIVGHDAAKRSLAALAYTKACIAAAHHEGAEADWPTDNVLLIGPTGSGKSAMCRAFGAALAPLGYLFESATAFTANGYVGASPEDLPRRLLDACGGMRDYAEFGMVVLDEIDKIASHASVDLDVGGRTLQAGLLRMMDGGLIRDHRSDSSLNMRSVTFFGTGTFEARSECSLPKIVLERLGDVPPGTGTQTARLLHHATHADLQAFGYLPEFASRFGRILVLDSPDYGTFVQMLRLPGGPLAPHTELCALHGIELVFEDDAIDLLAADAAASGRGGRGIHRADAALEDLKFELPEMVRRGVTRVVFSARALTGEAAARTETSAQRAEVPLARWLAGDVAGGGLTVSKASRGGSSDRVRDRLEAVKSTLGWADTTGSARKWWDAFERENKDRLAIVLRLAEELQRRQATITEFFLAYVYSNTDTIQANLHYLDYSRLKKQDEQNKRKARERANEETPDEVDDPFADDE